LEKRIRKLRESFVLRKYDIVYIPLSNVKNLEVKDYKNRNVVLLSLSV